MDTSRHIGVAQEYDTLRAELLEAKRYMFERPFAIAAAAAVGIQFLDKPERVTIPLVVAFLAVFSLWFTVDRLRSASRIVAYIQLVLEPPSTHVWVGWETSLRHYRAWLKSRTQAEVARYVRDNVEAAAVPDALMDYSTLYYSHLVLIGSAVVGAVFQLAGDPSARIVAFSAGAIVVSASSLMCLSEWRPSRVCGAIERDLVIWNAVLTRVGQQGLHQAAAGSSADGEVGRWSDAEGEIPGSP